MVIPGLFRIGMAIAFHAATSREMEATMENRILVALAVALVCMESRAQYAQHAVWRSQATQGPEWTGTVDLVKEDFLITVHPDYLDVQLDWEFGVGGNPPQAYGDALEIVGNVTLQSHSTVVGMLVWYKDKVLKAKLKTKDFARKQYEEVVDRNAVTPPKPRDPVLLEYGVRPDNYDISIFPVAWGGTRRIRLHYLVPSNVGIAGYPQPFSSKASVTIRPAPGVDEFGLDYGYADHRWFNGPVRLDPNRDVWALQSILTRRFDALSHSILYAGEFPGERFWGRMIHAYYIVPRDLRNRMSDEPGAAWKIFANLSSGKDTCRAEIPIPDTAGHMVSGLTVYSRNRTDPRIRWLLLKGGETILSVDEDAEWIMEADGLQYARSLAKTAFYPMSETMPDHLGVALGYIDEKYALVALEEDALPVDEARRYAESGVPDLDGTDIFPADGERFDIPTKVWMEQLGRPFVPVVQTYLDPRYRPVVRIKSRLPEGIAWNVREGRLEIRISAQALRSARSVRVSIHDCAGREVRSWGRAEIERGLLSWSPAESNLGPGAYFLRVAMDGKSFSARVAVP
jgi:hypothetical protein